MRTRLVAGAAASLAAAAAVSALAAAQTGGGPEPVTVSFLAIDRDGKPVMDLKSDEVQLRLNGRQRTIRSLQRVDVPSGGTPAAVALPPPFGTNVQTASGPAGRLFVFVIDDASFRPGNDRLVKQTIDQFLKTLGPDNRVALMTTPRPTTRTDPTSADEVRQALERVAGVATQQPTESDVACRTRDTLEALRGLMSNLAGARTPATVVFFSASLSGNTRAPVAIGSVPAGAFMCDLTTDHFQMVGAAVAAAKAHVYVVQGDPNVTGRSEGLDNLAGVAGAQVLVLSAATGNPLNRFAVETSSTYLAAFDPDPSERNGQTARLELRVTRADVTARAGTQLMIANEKAVKKGSVNAREMLRDATVYRDLPVRVAAFPSRDAGDNLKVVAVAEPLDPAVKLNAAVVGVYDAKGKLVAQSSAQPEMLARMPMMFAAVVPPGRYRIRFAATDSAGRGGSADQELPIELATAGALKMSALLLGVDAGGFRPVLEFKDEPAALATFEVYGKPPASLPLRMELAATVDGPPIQQVPPAGTGTKDPDRFIISGTFQLGTLAPGDYVVRAIVGSPETGEARLTRTLRKSK